MNQFQNNNFLTECFNGNCNTENESILAKLQAFKIIVQRASINPAVWHDIKNNVFQDLNSGQVKVTHSEASIIWILPIIYFTSNLWICNLLMIFETFKDSPNH